jgi:hypothetical protein
VVGHEAVPQFYGVVAIDNNQTDINGLQHIKLPVHIID